MEQPPSYPWAAIRQVLRIQAQLRAAVQEPAFKAQQVTEHARRLIEQSGLGLVLPALKDSALSISNAWGSSVPHNWNDLEPGELVEVIRLIEESAICLVWAPRAQVIRELLAESDDFQRVDVLGAALDTVIEDVETVLSTVAGVDDVHGHGDALAFAHEAAAAAKDNHVHAAQALAAAGLGAVLHDVWGYPLMRGLGQAFKRFSEQDLDDTSLFRMKWVLLQLCTANALTNTDVARAGYNRHGTQHGARPFFSAGSAAGGLLLLTAWVKEVAWLHEHHPQVFVATTDQPP